MINNKLRIGNFTSSEIGVLLSEGKTKRTFGKPAITYIEETNMERKLGRSLTDESSAKPITWGKLLESRAFNLLGLEYSLNSTETLQHPQIEYWTGSPDGFKHGTKKSVIDIKCPMTLKSFCQFADCKTIDEVRDNHPLGEKYYWQLVSNAILSNCDNAELIVYMPYLSELPIIRDMAQSVEVDRLSRHYWIAMGQDDDLPYLLDGGYYDHLHIIPFIVPNTEKEKLTRLVQLAGDRLIKI